MARGRPRKNPEDVLIRSAELIGWALGGLEREIVETKKRLAGLTAQANQLRARIGKKGSAARPLISGTPVPALSEQEAEAPSPQPSGRRRKRRKMSAEARKRMSEMMKKRWAERKKTS
jgi:hypothetical protein